MEERNQLNQRINSIQIIRGLACLFVILCHTQGTVFGLTCVFYFPVISGFVMMLSSEKHGVENYWKKRLNRILPLYYGATIFTSILILLLPDLFHSYEFSFVYLIKSLLFIPYYHNGVKGPIMIIGWILNYEMFFYFIFWLSMKISHKYRGLIAGLFLISYAVLGLLLPLPEIFAYWADSIIIDFALGIFAYYLWKIISKKYVMQAVHKTNAIITLIAYIVLFTSVFFMEWIFKVSANPSLAIGAVAFFVVLMFSLFDSYIKTFGIVLLLGNTSYELYLLHAFVVRTLDKIMGLFLPLNIFSSILNVLLTVIIIELALKVWNITWKIIKS